MWHYVALCGAMWRYLFSKFNDFFFSKKRLWHYFFLKFEGFEKKLWHYVALCGVIFSQNLMFFEKPKNGCGTIFFSNLKDLKKKNCGTMWHYVTLCVLKI